MFLLTHRSFPALFWRIGVCHPTHATLLTHHSHAHLTVSPHYHCTKGGEGGEWYSCPARDVPHPVSQVEEWWQAAETDDLAGRLSGDGAGGCGGEV